MSSARFSATVPAPPRDRRSGPQQGQQRPVRAAGGRGSKTRASAAAAPAYYGADASADDQLPVIETRRMRAPAGGRAPGAATAVPAAPAGSPYSTYTGSNSRYQPRSSAAGAAAAPNFSATAPASVGGPTALAAPADGRPGAGRSAAPGLARPSMTRLSEVNRLRDANRARQLRADGLWLLQTGSTANGLARLRESVELRTAAADAAPDAAPTRPQPPAAAGEEPPLWVYAEECVLRANGAAVRLAAAGGPEEAVRGHYDTAMQLLLKRFQDGSRPRYFAGHPLLRKALRCQVLSNIAALDRAAVAVSVGRRRSSVGSSVGGGGGAAARASRAGSIAPDGALLIPGGEAAGEGGYDASAALTAVVTQLLRAVRASEGVMCTGALYNLAAALLAAGRFDEATEAVARCIELCQAYLELEPPPGVVRVARATTAELYRRSADMYRPGGSGTATGADGRQSGRNNNVDGRDYAEAASDADKMAAVYATFIATVASHLVHCHLLIASLSAWGGELNAVEEYHCELALGCARRFLAPSHPLLRRCADRRREATARAHSEGRDRRDNSRAPPQLPLLTQGEYLPTPCARVPELALARGGGDGGDGGNYYAYGATGGGVADAAGGGPAIPVGAFLPLCLRAGVPDALDAYLDGVDDALGAKHRRTRYPPGPRRADLEDAAARTLQRNWRAYADRQARRRDGASRVIQRNWRRQRTLRQEAEHRAAGTIQRGWRSHRARDELDRRRRDAAEWRRRSSAARTVQGAYGRWRERQPARRELEQLREERRLNRAATVVQQFLRQGESAEEWGRRCLAALSQRQDERMRHTAAVAIQARWRRHKAEQQLRDSRDAATRVQSAWRGKRARDEAGRLRAERDARQRSDAATRIQSGWRGKRARDEAGALRQERDARQREGAATRIQSGWRGKRARDEANARREERRQNDAATRIQSGWRGKVARDELESLREARRRNDAATRIQSGWRGRQGRQRAGALREARDAEEARKWEVVRRALTRHVLRWRGQYVLDDLRDDFMARKVAERRAAMREAAATRIQRQTRPFLERRRRQRAAEEAAARDAAALRIQTQYRRHAAAQHAGELRARREEERAASDRRAREHEAATRVQSAWRGHAAREQLPGYMRLPRDERNRRAASIQRQWRGHHARRRAAEERRLRDGLARARQEDELRRCKAVVIQSAVRMFLVRRRLAAGGVRLPRADGRPADGAADETLERAATRIQTAWRGSQARAHVNGMRVNRRYDDEDRARREQEEYLRERDKEREEAEAYEEIDVPEERQPASDRAYLTEPPGARSPSDAGTAPFDDEGGDDDDDFFSRGPPQQQQQRQQELYPAEDERPEEKTTEAGAQALYPTEESASPAARTYTDDERRAAVTIQRYVRGYLVRRDIEYYYEEVTEEVTEEDEGEEEEGEEEEEEEEFEDEY